MAPTLTSNSFLLTTTPRSTLSQNNPKFTVFAKAPGPFSSFRLGKQKDGSPATENQTEESTKPNPFSFDFGKISDGKSLIPVINQTSTAFSFVNRRRKDPRTVFVAGATGQAGIRIAQMLLREGFTVRAGVPELGAAQEIARLAVDYKIISSDESKRINAVESTFQDAESIAKAIGNASKLVVTISPEENGPTTEVTTSDALQVIQAAQLAGVDHVAIIYDDRSLSPPSTYNVLDGISSFFNNIFSGSQPLSLTEFLQKLVETNCSYTVIKTMLTEDYSPESSYSVVVSAEGNPGSIDYKVSKSQIATLVADVFSNTAVAENKVVEVSTDPRATKKPTDELFRAIPEDGRRKAYAEAQTKAKAEEEALRASEKAKAAALSAKKLEEEVAKLSKQEAKATSLAKDAQEKAEAVGPTMDNLLDRAKTISSGFSWGNLSTQIASAVPKPEEKPKVQIATSRGQAKARNLPAKKAIIKPPSFTFPTLNAKEEPTQKSKPSFTFPTLKAKEEPTQKSKPTEKKPEVRKVLGGLFKQETIYIDDD